MSDSLIPSFWWVMWVNRSGHSPKMSNVSELLSSLTKNERPWAICSGRSEEVSDCERIAQVAHQKWENESIGRFFERIAHSLIFGQNTSDSLGKLMSEVQALLFSFSFFYKLPILRKCTLLQNNLCEDQLYYQNLNYQKVGEWQINCHGNVDESIRTVRQSTTICKLSMNLYKKSLLNLSCKWPWKFRFCNSPLQFKTI